MGQKTSVRGKILGRATAPSAPLVPTLMCVVFFFMDNSCAYKYFIPLAELGDKETEIIQKKEWMRRRRQGRTGEDKTNGRREERPSDDQTSSTTDHTDI